MSEAPDNVSSLVVDPVEETACSECGCVMDVSSLAPFSEINCPECGAPQTIPARLGHFLLLHLIGMGGMGGVYRAMDESLGRMVAIKVMLKSLGDDPKFIETFQREAQSAAKLNHPNIAQIYSFGQEKGQPYIVMEFVPGNGMNKLIESDGQLMEPLVMKIGLQMAEGLNAADQIGLLHGDIKPENILLDERKNGKLVDFGLASYANQASPEGIWGTPYYIAPEKVKKEPTDARSDMYSLGATLYHALAGRPPFEGSDPIEVVKARLQNPPPPLHEVRPYVNRHVENIVMRMLEEQPSRRYPSYVPVINDIKKTIEALKSGSSADSAPITGSISMTGTGPVPMERLFQEKELSPEEQAALEEQKKAAARRLKIAALTFAATVLLLAGIGASLFFLRKSSENKQENMITRVTAQNEIAKQISEVHHELTKLSTTCSEIQNVKENAQKELETIDSIQKDLASRKLEGSEFEHIEKEAGKEAEDAKKQILSIDEAIEKASALHDEASSLAKETKKARELSATSSSLEKIGEHITSIDDIKKDADNTLLRIRTIRQEVEKKAALLTNILPYWTFPHKMKISFAGYDKSETLFEFPALVIFSENLPEFNYGEFVSTNGSDLRFSDETLTNELPYEIEQWNTSGESFIWVKVPELKRNTSIWAYWGNGELAAPKYASDGTTWNPDYEGVWHLGETRGRHKDSTANSLNSTSIKVTRQGSAQGKIGGADELDGNDDVIRAEPINKKLKTATIEAWISGKAVKNLLAGIVFMRHKDKNINTASGLHVFVNGNELGYHWTDAKSSYEYHSHLYLPNDTMSYVTLTVDPSKAVLRLNGSTVTNFVPHGEENFSLAKLAIGADPSSDNFRPWDGIIDEVRFSKTARSDNWLCACWKNQGANADFNLYTGVADDGSLVASPRKTAPDKTENPEEQKELKTAKELAEKASVFIEKNLFADAVEGLKTKAAEFQTEDGKKAIVLLIEKYSLMEEMRIFLVKKINIRSFPKGWGTGSVAKDILAADNDSIKITGRTVPWSQVSPLQMIALIEQYVDREKSDSSKMMARVNLGAAIFCNETGQKDSAGKYTAKAIELDPSIATTAEDLLSPNNQPSEEN